MQIVVKTLIDVQFSSDFQFHLCCVPFSATGSMFPRFATLSSLSQAFRSLTNFISQANNHEL